MQEMRSYWGDASRLTGFMLAFWVLAGAISCGLHGFSGVELTGFSLVICLIPGWLALIVPAVYRAPAAALAAVVVGMVLRLAFCGVGIAVVSWLRPDLGPKPFVWWLVGFYLVSLGAETYLLVRRVKLQAAA